jgi:hypothetical protein
MKQVREEWDELAFGEEVVKKQKTRSYGQHSSLLHTDDLAELRNTMLRETE